jgi:hypothetical protein
LRAPYLKQGGHTAEFRQSKISAIIGVFIIGMLVLPM